MRLTCMTMALVLWGALAAGIGQRATAQQQQPASPAPEDSFASENAVLDTSILFAIGAREARQELRGAFGWPTFQEGLVEGVYFRFDPDGYARFAPTPRLDTDVFEVICRPRTLVCMGRKEALQITLNNRGQVQLQLDNVSDADTFAISEGINELPLPRSILQPLDARLEILLASGGELIGRRGEQEIHRISLAGFGAVVPYLRWVAAQQDYTVLPRGWPVPNAAMPAEAPGLTRTSSWASPMPQPHVVSQTIPAPAAQAAETPGVQTDVAEVRGELNVLREMMLDRQRGPASAELQAVQPPYAAPPQDRMQELQAMAQMLQAEIARLQQPAVAFPPSAPVAASPAEAAAETPAAEEEPVKAPVTDAQRMAQHMEYLMTELGLAPDVALMVIQQRQEVVPAVAEAEQATQDTVITDILEELRAQIPQLQMPPADDAPAAAPALAPAPVPVGDYQLLSDYFRSVLPAK